MIIACVCRGNCTIVDTSHSSYDIVTCMCIHVCMYLYRWVREKKEKKYWRLATATLPVVTIGVVTLVRSFNMNSLENNELKTVRSGIKTITNYTAAMMPMMTRLTGQTIGINRLGWPTKEEKEVKKNLRPIEKEVKQNPIEMKFYFNYFDITCIKTVQRFLSVIRIRCIIFFLKGFFIRSWNYLKRESCYRKKKFFLSFQVIWKKFLCKIV